jgi:hypothetical protein
MSAKQLEAVAFCEPDDSTLPKKTTSGNRHNWPQWLLVLLPFAIIWAALISHLSVEWRVNPQYSHGWVVPFLCLSLLLGRFQKIGTRADSPCETNGRGKMILFFAALAFLWLPTRLLEEANPEWRMISWLLALETIGLTLVAIALRSGLPRVAQLAFPICFFLVAVPWPTFIESPLIQLLTNICASATVEVVGWLGIPALQHGNIIEVATGPVPIGISSRPALQRLPDFILDLDCRNQGRACHRKVSRSRWRHDHDRVFDRTVARRFGDPSPFLGASFGRQPLASAQRSFSRASPSRALAFCLGSRFRCGSRRMVSFS